MVRKRLGTPELNNTFRRSASVRGTPTKLPIPFSLLNTWLADSWARASVISIQCCRSVMKKNPRIYLEKKTENNKKRQTCKMFKKSQNQTWKARYRYLHMKIKVICIVCIIFSTSSSLLTSQFTSRLAARQMYEVT